MEPITTFRASPVAGVTVVDFVRHEDVRGSFQRLWCARDFAAGGLSQGVVQVSLSHTLRRGTLRGLHFQLPPSREAKLVQCVRGHIYDVAVDLRPGSETFLRHYGLELAESVGRALFIPPGCGHGFLTLSDDCSIVYMMSDFFDANLSSGVRWDDPALNVQWPEQPLEILERDAGYPDIEISQLDVFSGY